MIKTTIQTRFSDFDMGGHAHNAVYLNYFEAGRVGFFTQGIGKEWDWKKDGLIVKKNTIEYHAPIFIDQEISVAVTCTHIGNTSFTLAYDVMDETGHLKASGESVIVSFNYHKNEPQKISPVIKSLLLLHLAKN